MNTEDLSMVNLHATAGGGWSWTAYRKPHEMWRSNKGVADFWLCLEELQLCLAEEAGPILTPFSREAAEQGAAGEGSSGASGGMRSKLADERRRKALSRQRRRRSASDRKNGDAVA